MRSLLLKGLIVLFCLWHVTAITVYSLPQQIVNLALFKAPTAWLLELSRPYTMQLSLWQKWPLFAPDPLRRVAEFTMEADLGGNWVAVHRLAPGTVKWWDRATTLKMVRRLESRKHQERNRVLNAQLMRYRCKQLALPPQTPVRLKVDYFVIPKTTQPPSIAWWQQWQPIWKNYIQVETNCPDRYS